MIRALVAEDERPARDKLARMLEELGATVVARCVDGIDAARAIEELQPDVALLDIQMPGIGGLELVAQLDGERAPLVVFVTAFDEHAVRAFELNAVDYLLKPATGRLACWRVSKHGSRMDTAAMWRCRSRGLRWVPLSASGAGR